MKHILFFGDSLTAGYGLSDPAKESFPGLIGVKIVESGLGYSITNAGLSGDTSAGAGPAENTAEKSRGNNGAGKKKISCRKSGCHGYAIARHYHRGSSEGIQR